jgi:molybdenum cofactor guanylyltransferase
MRRAGYVLVGGRSSRMGRDKALLVWGGQPLAAIVARKVREAAGEATLVGPPEVYGGLGYRVIADLEAGRGPLGGIVTALADSGAEWNLIVACDLPGIETVLLETLLEEAAQRDVSWLVPRTPDGRLHPVCSVFHRRLRGALERLAERKMLRLQDAARRLGAFQYPVTEPLVNVNTMEEWSRWSRTAGSPAGPAAGGRAHG